MPDIPIPAVLYRGGTSRGLLFLEEHVPVSRELLAPILLRAFGSPDTRQIDGAGGATSLTSKAIIVGADAGPDADVHMLFAQVGVTTPTVDFGGNCGNMTAAVGPFAIEAGLVAVVEPITVVRIRSVNTGVFVRAHVPVRRGRVVTEGDFAIAGVPGTAARLDLEWLRPGGALTGRLLPTGRPRDEFVLSDGRRIEVSIVDAGNPSVFCAASSLGLTGTELPAVIEQNAAAMRALEEIRSITGEMLGIVRSRADATKTSPGLPKVAFVARSADYRTTTGELLSANTHDFQARLMSMQTAHRTYAGAGSIATSVAARIPGTVVFECASDASGDRGRVRIAHPGGVMDVGIDMGGTAAEPEVLSATVPRTARRIMSGEVWVPESLVPSPVTSPLWLRGPSC